MKTVTMKHSWAAAVVAALSFGGEPALAQETGAAFFQNKQIRFYTMGSPGGGYDAYTRALGSFLEKKLSTRVIPTNEPAAGGVVAMNRTTNAPPDGLTMVLIGGEALVTGQLYGLPGVNYDVRKQVWLARVSNEAKVAMIGPQSPHKSIADMQKSEKPVIWAGSGKADGNSDFSAIMGHALGIKTRIIIGYKGTGDMNLAIQRGEVDGRVVSDEAAALYGPSSGMRVVTVLSREKSEKFPDVPTVFQAATLDAGKAKLIDWRAGIADLGRVILVTPGTPQDRVDALRKAFAEIIRDPAFIEETAKFKLSVNYASGEQLQSMVNQAMQTLDDKGLAEVREIALDRYYSN